MKTLLTGLLLVLLISCGKKTEVETRYTYFCQINTRQDIIDYFDENINNMVYTELEADTLTFEDKYRRINTRVRYFLDPKCNQLIRINKLY